MTLRSMETETGGLAARRGARPRVPIDVAHLEAQTMGNRDLRNQVLRLFLRQAEEQIGRIRSAGETATEARREAARTLVGAARGIGAFPVAYIASEIEVSKGPVAGRLLALDRAFGAVRIVIAELLRQ